MDNELYHIYNRGNNKQQLFFSDEDYMAFLGKLRFNVVPHCDLLTWCIMPNHFHLMVRANANSCKERPSFGGKPMQELSYRIGVALSSYSQQINKRQKQPGHYFNKNQGD